MKKMNKKGFTIVELVIVIAVIAILAAVLIPTFSGIVAEANKSAGEQSARAHYTQDLVALDGDIANYGKDAYMKYAETEDTSYNAEKTYYTEANGVYTEATFDAQNPAFAEGTTYYEQTGNVCVGAFTNGIYSVEVDGVTYTLTDGKWN